MNDSQKEIYTQIWIKYKPAMLRYCKGKLNRYEEDAKDIIIDAFTILWEKILKDGIPEYPQAFLYKTIDNLLKYKYRTIRKNNENCVLHSIDEEIYMPYTQDVAEQYELEQLDEERISRANQTLKEDEKQILHYHYMEEKTYEEIAGILNSTKTAIKQKKFRASKKLHKISDKAKKDLGFF